jgi:hypothetical protein
MGAYSQKAALKSSPYPPPPPKAFTVKLPVRILQKIPWEAFLSPFIRKHPQKPLCFIQIFPFLCIFAIFYHFLMTFFSVFTW